MYCAHAARRVPSQLSREAALACSRSAAEHEHARTRRHSAWFFLPALVRAGDRDHTRIGVGSSLIIITRCIPSVSLYRYS